MSAPADHAGPADAADHADHPDHADVPGDVALRAKALVSLLVDKGLVQQAQVDGLVERFESQIGPHLGARVIARAWTDPEFRQRLLDNGTEAVTSMGIGGWRPGTRLVALENTPEVHNLVVCTLCSCYPMNFLGTPPVWYKSAPFRSRAVKDPRGVLAEFGTELPAGVEVRVWDSNSEVRYLVIPRRPPGTEALSEEELASLVSRNAMIGTALAAPPTASSPDVSSPTDAAARP
jgi:nitrile hydratase